MVCVKDRRTSAVYAHGGCVQEEKEALTQPSAMKMIMFPLHEKKGGSRYSMSDKE